jgi:hypothetical protein
MRNFHINFKSSNYLGPQVTNGGLDIFFFSKINAKQEKDKTSNKEVYILGVIL